MPCAFRNEDSGGDAVQLPLRRPAIDEFLDEFEGAVYLEQAMSAIETAATEFVQRSER